MYIFCLPNSQFSRIFSSMWRSLSSLLISLALVQSKQLPDFLKELRCSLSEDLEACYIKNAAKAIPIIVKGLPDLNIPVLDPYQIPFLQAISTPDLTINFTNTKLYGLKDLRPVKVEQSKNGNDYIITLNDRNIKLTGEYSANGRISIMPIRGSGSFNIQLENCTFDVSEKAKSIMKDGEEYLVTTKVTVKQRFQKAVFNFDNLFEGNKKLGDEVNKFLNENSDIVLEELGGGIIHHVENLAVRIISGFSENVPLKDYYLP